MAAMSSSSITIKTLSSSPPYPSQFSLQTPPNSIFFPTSQSTLPALYFPTDFYQHKTSTTARRVSVVTRAGPTSGQLIFAFVFPVSLLAITVFTAFRIGNKLDQKFLEELAINEALREAEEDGNGEPTETVAPRKEEPALPRTRNRPKREI